MKIAVTYENGQIFQHFGHTEQFKLYEAADGKVTHAEVVDTNGSGHGALAGFLMQHGVDTLICGKDTQRGIGVHRQPLRGRGELQVHLQQREILNVRGSPELYN